MENCLADDPRALVWQESFDVSHVTSVHVVGATIVSLSLRGFAGQKVTTSGMAALDFRTTSLSEPLSCGAVGFCLWHIDPLAT